MTKRKVAFLLIASMAATAFLPSVSADHDSDTEEDIELICTGLGYACTGPAHTVACLTEPPCYHDEYIDYYRDYARDNAEWALHETYEILNRAKDAVD